MAYGSHLVASGHSAAAEGGKPKVGGGEGHEIAGYANGENAVHVYVCIVNVREPSNVIELI